MLLVFNSVVSFLKDESGQSMVEYGLLISLLVVGAIAALELFGKNLSDMFDNRISPKVNKAINP
ncbi:MAG: Flp family type IVb pilin [Erysipelotrichaceae bacterium]|nr:Flp family type IVb pilin [Erysipelotrichaceae bacterium]